MYVWGWVHTWFGFFLLNLVCFLFCFVSGWRLLVVWTLPWTPFEAVPRRQGTGWEGAQCSCIHVLIHSLVHGFVCRLHAFTFFTFDPFDRGLCWLIVCVPLQVSNVLEFVLGKQMSKDFPPKGVLPPPQFQYDGIEYPYYEVSLVYILVRCSIGMYIQPCLLHVHTHNTIMHIECVKWVQVADITVLPCI